MTASNDVNQPLTTFLADELMTSWRAGMCDGLEMAAKMCRGLIDHPETSREQCAALTGLFGALRQAGVELAVEERTR